MTEDTISIGVARIFRRWVRPGVDAGFLVGGTTFFVCFGTGPVQPLNAPLCPVGYIVGYTVSK